ncbi:hypothetical protein BP5796_00065 [Coleophoma crateriformis]|uniref:Peptidase S8/S53 domain-containing protein n=1 Tax=Coleophoma crateriformis TaxID=565419 RepID=A0A3D8T6T5_9HELO|nr:hypothetical protein BP5796_00065 [Coleophoma crateriformis]
MLPTAHSTPAGPSSVPANKNRAVTLQTDALPELKAMSQPDGADVNTLAAFAHDKTGGAGITVYVVDTGANPDHSEWINMPGEKRFIFLTPGDTESDPGRHGSCVASKVAGPKFGVAKNANIVIVKLPSVLTMSSVIAALAEVGNDVSQRNLEGKAVINISIGSRVLQTDAASRDNIINAYKLFLASIIAQDIVVVAASGNSRMFGIENVNELPAIFEPDMPIIVVGAVDLEGFRTFYSQGTDAELTVSAPGDVTCAGSSGTGDVELFGTSFASPAVAGLAATLLSLDQFKTQLQIPGKVAENTKALIKSLAFSRVAGEPLVAWNGLDPQAQSSTSSTSSRQPTSSTSSSKPTSTSTKASTTSSSVSTSTSAAPTPKVLYTLDNTITAGTTSCQPTSDFQMQSQTYGFMFQVDNSMQTSIETGTSSQGYFVGSGSSTGTFFYESGGALSICGTNTGTADLPLKFILTEAPVAPVATPKTSTVFTLKENVDVGTSTCFPTDGAGGGPGTYTFTYSVAAGTLVTIGDSSAGPRYFSGQGSGSGTMLLDTSPNALSICAQNTGGSATVLDLKITQ